jgi:hypothetical protein
MWLLGQLFQVKGRGVSRVSYGPIRTPTEMRPYVGCVAFQVHWLIAPRPEAEPTVRDAVDRVFAEFGDVGGPGSDLADIVCYLDSITEPLGTIRQLGLALYGVQKNVKRRGANGAACSDSVSHLFVIPYPGYFRVDSEGAPVHSFCSTCRRAADDLVRSTVTEVGMKLWLLQEDIEKYFETAAPWCSECCLAEITSPSKNGLLSPPQLRITSAVVERAIQDAEALLKSGGPTSALDRVHTTLHGYLLNACDQAGIHHETDPSILHLFHLLWKLSVMRAFANIVDSLNPARNRGSMAHPNQELLGESEAALFINAARAILHYLDAKLQD